MALQEGPSTTYYWEALLILRHCRTVAALSVGFEEFLILAKG